MKIGNGTLKDADERGIDDKMLLLLQRTAVLLLLLAVSGSVVIGSGVFDPKPVGPLQMSAHPGTMIVLPGEIEMKWLEIALPAADFSVRETAVFRTGEPDSLFGLILGSDDIDLLIAVSPLGYVTINNQQPTTIQPSALSPQSSVLFPLQPWPHVGSRTAPNEIWVDVVDGEMTVRINRELLWTGPIEITPDRMGLFGQSFGETAVFDFQSAAVFSESN